MWCLETLIAINERLANGRTLQDAYADCGISVPADNKAISVREDKSAWEMKPPPLKAAS